MTIATSHPPRSIAALLLILSCVGCGGADRTPAAAAAAQPEASAKSSEATTKAAVKVASTFPKKPRPTRQALLDVWWKRFTSGDEGSLGAAHGPLISLGSDAVPRLIEIRKDPKLRPQAARILGAIGKPAIPSIHQLLKEGSNQDKAFAVSCLAAVWEGRGSLPELAKDLAVDLVGYVKSLDWKSNQEEFGPASRVLEGMGPAFAPAAGLLLPMANDPALAVWVGSLFQSMGAAVPPEASAKFLAILNDEKAHPEVRAIAYRVLLAQGKSPPLEPALKLLRVPVVLQAPLVYFLPPEAYVDPRVEEVLRGPPLGHSQIAYRVRRELAAFTPALVQWLNDPVTARVALQMLVAKSTNPSDRTDLVPPPETVPGIIKLLEKPATCNDACLALLRAGVNSPEAKKALLPWLKDKTRMKALMRPLPPSRSGLLDSLDAEMLESLIDPQDSWTNSWVMRSLSLTKPSQETARFVLSALPRTGASEDSLSTLQQHASAFPPGALADEIQGRLKKQELSPSLAAAAWARIDRNNPRLIALVEQGLANAETQPKFQYIAIQIGRLAVPALARLLETPDRAKRAELLEQLSRISWECGPAASALIQMATDEDEAIRSRVGGILWRLGPAAGESLRKEADSKDRLLRAKVLGLLSGHREPQNLPLFTAALDDPDPSCRSAGARGLELLPAQPLKPAVVARLVELLKDPDENVHQRAAMALLAHKQHERAAAARLLERPYSLETVLPLVGSDQPRALELAMVGFWALPAEEKVSRLKTMYAIQAFSREAFTPPGSTAPLDALLKDKDLKVRTWAAAVLIKLRPSRAPFDVLVSALETGLPPDDQFGLEVGVVQFHAMGSMGTDADEVVPLLEMKMNEPQYEQESAIALWRIAKQPAALEVLLARLKTVPPESDGYRKHMKARFGALAESEASDPKAHAAILALVAKGEFETEVRAAAAWALWKMSARPQAMGLLRTDLRNPGLNYNVTYTLKVLGQIGPEGKEAAADVEAWLDNHPMYNVREAAFSALVAIAPDRAYAWAARKAP